MTDSYNETSRKELGYIGTVSNGESLNFSTLGTFDSSDSAEQNRSDNQQTQNISHLGTPRKEFTDASGVYLGGQEGSREHQTSASPVLDMSPLSSISTDDSFPESPSDTRTNQLSIFRPKFEVEYGDSRNGGSHQSSSEPEMSTKQHSAQKSSNQLQAESSGNHARHPKYDEGNAYPTTSRQVSVTENRSFKSRNSFDSLGNAPRRVDSAFDKQHGGNAASITGLERRHDMESSPRRDVNSAYYDRMNHQNETTSYNYQSKRPPHENKGRAVSKTSQVSKRDGQLNTAIVTPRKQYKPKNINYLMILRPRANLFAEFTFLLPGLKMYVTNFLSSEKHKWGGYRRKYEDVIAKRRLVCAVRAYGGNMFPRPHSQQQNSASSIFRFKNEDVGSREKYDQSLPLRYYENNNHLSWDVEENPPIGSPEMNSTHLNKSEDENDNRDQAQTGDSSVVDNEDNVAASEGKDETSSDETPKTRYRCKLCGQPKQNHTCPYQQALQRNIGTMSYPALNAFQCKENGKLAPALSDMNNFVDLENEFDDEYGEDMMTPDGCKSGDFVSGGTSAQKRPISSISATEASANQYQKGIWAKRRKTRRIKKEEKNEKYQGDDKLFHQVMDIKPEQYRLVSPRATNQLGDFRYPTLPLAFEQRKNASEDLFKLSQQIANLSEECAEVLQIARESNAWDLAVAELTTQVLVIMHCPLGDDALNGLRRHLKTIGISS